MRCLIVRFSSLGDIILTTPVVESLAEAGAEVHFAVATRYAELLAYFPRPMTGHAFSGRTQGDLANYAAGFADRRFDLVLDLHANWRSRMLVRRLGTQHVLTYPGDFFRRWSMVYLKRGFIRARHVVERYLETIRETQIPVVTSVPRLVITAQEKASAQRSLTQLGWSSDRSTIGIGWGARWPTKKVPVKLWGELAARLKTTPAAYLIFAAAQDQTEVAEFVERSGRENVFPVVGKPLPDVLGAISFCHAFVSSDSGLMHAAAALGVPTLGIFGPTHPALGFAPRGPGSHAIHSGIFCSPCSRHGRAPCYRRHRHCFERTNVEALAELVREHLRGSIGR